MSRYVSGCSADLHVSSPILSYHRPNEFTSFDLTTSLWAAKSSPIAIGTEPYRNNSCQQLQFLDFNLDSVMSLSY